MSNIAICFAGQLRNVASSYTNWIKPRLLDPNLHHHIDIYVHAWYSQEDEGNIYLNSGNIPCCAPIPPTILNDVYRLYNPKSMTIEKQLDFSSYPKEKWDPLRYPSVSIPNSLSRMYSTHKSVNLAIDYSNKTGCQYDLFVITRFDCTIPIPLVLDEWCQNSFADNNRIINFGPSPHNFNGVIIWGKWNAIFKYLKLPSKIGELIDAGSPWCDEYLIQAHLKNEGITLETVNTSIPMPINMQLTP